MDIIFINKAKRAKANKDKGKVTLLCYIILAEYNIYLSAHSIVKKIHEMCYLSLFSDQSTTIISEFKGSMALSLRKTSTEKIYFQLGNQDTADSFNLSITVRAVVIPKTAEY